MKLLLKKINSWTHDRKQMWLPDANLCYFILSAARPCVAVLLHGAATSSAISPQMHQQNPADAPPESHGTTRIRRTPTESCLHLQRVYLDRCRSSARRCGHMTGCVWVEMLLLNVLFYKGELTFQKVSSLWRWANFSRYRRKLAALWNASKVS